MKDTEHSGSDSSKDCGWTHHSLPNTWDEKLWLRSYSFEWMQQSKHPTKWSSHRGLCCMASNENFFFQFGWHITLSGNINLVLKWEESMVKVHRGLTRFAALCTNQGFFSRPRFPISRRKPEISLPSGKVCYRTKKSVTFEFWLRNTSLSKHVNLI
jgi:hypothetical protein